MNEHMLKQQLSEAIGTPPTTAVGQSLTRVQDWFAQTAPVIYWTSFESPLGALYVAASKQGLIAVNFGIDTAAFLNELDPIARTEQSSSRLAVTIAQFKEYFAGKRTRFDIPVDLSRITPFQRRVLDATARIPSGALWTYAQVAKAINQPKASRAVGQALGRNPVPIVIPCHRVIASDGGLGGYSGGGGLASKQLLLHHEGAL